MSRACVCVASGVNEREGGVSERGDTIRNAKTYNLSSKLEILKLIMYNESLE